MPRKRLPPRLKTKQRSWTDKSGITKTETFWHIFDGEVRISTGCRESEIDQASKKLQEYILDQHEPVERGGDPSRIAIADILSVYYDHRDPALDTHRGKELFTQIGMLNDFWGNLTVRDVNAAKCKAYTAQRTTESMARHELEVLRAALNHYHRQYVLTYVPTVTLPDKPRARQKWLTRSEAAQILWSLWKHKNPAFNVYDRRHLARFFLDCNLYRHTRKRRIETSVAPQQRRRPCGPRSQSNLSSIH